MYNEYLSSIDIIRNSYKEMWLLCFSICNDVHYKNNILNEIFKFRKNLSKVLDQCYGIIYFIYLLILSNNSF